MPSTPDTASVTSRSATAARDSTIIRQNGSHGLVSTPPADRYPAGGYRHAPAAALACSADSTFGTMTPAQPRSSARPMSAGCAYLTLAIGAAPVWLIAVVR